MSGHLINAPAATVLPASSGYILRSQGIDGSLNGLGVFSSKNIGRFIATFEPLRDRIFAVSVLQTARLLVIHSFFSFTPGAYNEKRSTHGNRACGLVISCGRKRLWLDTASAGSKYGSVNTPGAPRRGNDVNERGISWGLRCRRARLRLPPPGKMINNGYTLGHLNIVLTGSACCLPQTSGLIRRQYRVRPASTRACIGHILGGTSGQRN